MLPEKSAPSRAAAAEADAVRELPRPYGPSATAVELPTAITISHARTARDHRSASASGSGS